MKTPGATYETELNDLATALTAIAATAPGIADIAVAECDSLRISGAAHRLIARARACRGQAPDEALSLSGASTSVLMGLRGEVSLSAVRHMLWLYMRQASRDGCTARTMHALADAWNSTHERNELYIPIQRRRAHKGKWDEVVQVDVPISEIPLSRIAELRGWVV